MTLRKTALAIIFSTLAGLSLLLFFTSRHVFMASFDDLERKVAAQRMNQAISALDMALERLDHFAFDWAAWDQSYDFVIDKNPDYVESNLSPEAFSDLGLTHVLYLGLDGTLAWGGGYDRDRSVLRQVPSEIAALFGAGTRFMDLRDPGDSMSGLLSTPQGVLACAARPIITSRNQGPVRGILVMTRRVDKKFVAELRRQTLLDLNLATHDQPGTLVGDSGTTGRLTAPGQMEFMVLDDGRLAVHAAIPDIIGGPAMVMEIITERTIHDHGIQALKRNFMILLGVCTIFGALALLLLERRILARMAALNMQLERVTARGGPENRVAVAGNDELAGLGRGVNKMLEKLESARNDLKDSETRLRQVIHFAPVGIFQSSPAGELLSVNPQGLKMYGYDSMEDMSEHVRNLEQLYVDPEDRRRWMDKVERDKRVSGFEARVRRKDGSQFWMSLHVRTVRDARENTIRHEGFSIDITARKQAEERLARRLEYESVLDSCAKILFKSPGRSALGEVMDILRRATGADRAVLAENVDLEGQGTAFCATLESTDQDKTFPIPNESEDGITYARALPGWEDGLSSGRSMLGPVGPYSVLAQPLFAGGKWHGFLGLYSNDTGRTWSEGEQLFMFTASEIIGAQLERSRSEQALRRSEQRLNLAQEMAMVGSWAEDLAAGEYKWSDEMYKLLGLDDERPEPADHVLLGRVHPADSIRVADAFARIRTKGQDFDIEFRYLPGKTGERHAHAKAIVETGPDGSPAHILGTFQDITQHIRHEQALRRFEFIANSVAEFMTLIDANYTYVAVNKAYLRSVNKTTDEVVGLTLGQIWGDDVFEKNIKANLDRCFAGHRVTYETEFRFHGEGVNHYEVNYFPYRDEIGQVTHVVVVTRDTTKRKLAEEALADLNSQLENLVEIRTGELKQAKEEAEAANRMKSDFLSTVSHELRTPLTSVFGFAQLIKWELETEIIPRLPKGDPALDMTARQLLENAGIIIVEGERLRGLIDDVLDLSRLQGGRVAMAMQDANIRELAERALNTTSALINERSLETSLEVEPGLPAVHCDPDRIIQVLINLISNAIKFTRRGSVRCRVHRQDDVAVVDVIDTGIGIPEEDHKAIFGKFRQIGDTHTDKPQGSGLGLSISKEIVERHGGSIWVRSVPGQGSTFSFSLPLAQTDDPVSEPEPGGGQTTSA